jgi:type 1 fimbria pilin
MAGLKMKHSTNLVSILLVLGLPIAAQAACESYPPDAELGLSLPAVITVPDSLPLGSVIAQQAFSGSVPALFYNCRTGTPASAFGRYARPLDPITGSYPTEAPGVGMRLLITDARPSTSAYAIESFSGAVVPPGRHPSFTNAEVILYKIGPVTDGVVPAGTIFEYRLHGPWGYLGRFSLRLNNSVRFVRPAATCDLAAGDVNRTISLDPVQVSVFQNAISAGARDFELTANCSDATHVTFRFAGTPAPGHDALFANTGSAGGVGLWLYSRVNGVAQTITANGTDSSRTLVVSDNRAVLPLGAAYHKNGAVSQGTLASTATVNITYN